MASIIAKRYGKALFDLAQEQNCLDRIQTEADWIEQIWKEQPQLKTMLLLPTMPKEEKRKALSLICEGSVSSPLIGLLCLLVDKGRIIYLPEILEEYRSLHLAAARIARATVTSAAPLTEEDQRRIQQSLERALHRQVVLMVQTDEELIGGLTIRVGDQIFDNSLRTKLHRLKKDLLQNKNSQEVAR